MMALIIAYFSIFLFVLFLIILFSLTTPENTKPQQTGYKIITYEIVCPYCGETYIKRFSEDLKRVECKTCGRGFASDDLKLHPYENQKLKDKPKLDPDVALIIPGSVSEDNSIKIT